MSGIKVYLFMRAETAKWTEQELNFLRENRYLPRKELAKRLGKTHSQIRYKVCILDGLRKSARY